MRFLLFLSDTASETACSDFLKLHGFEVDATTDADRAEALSRFRAYDCVIADLLGGEAAAQQTAQIFGFARKRNDDVVPVLLSTTETAPDRLMQPCIGFTKPVSLRTILDAVDASAERASTRRSIHGDF